MRLTSFKGGQPNIRAILAGLGVGPFDAAMSIQYAFFLPSTTDPDAQGVQQLVAALQRGLRALGYGVEVDGVLGPRTAEAVRQVSGPAWRDKTWAQLLEDVVTARPLPKPMRWASGRDALGYVSPSSWGHTSKGACKPNDAATLEAFRNLQRQANRVNKALGGAGPVAADGVIGRKTVEAVKAAGRAASARLSVTTRGAILAVTSCDSLARIADVLGEELRSIADAAGAPKSVASPAPNYTATVSPDGSVSVQEAGLFGLSPLSLAALGVGALLLWQQYSKPKRR